MKLQFKQRFFSWLDSYDVYDENGNVYFKVEGQLAFSHTFNIYDKNGKFVGKLKQAILSFLPTFYIYNKYEKEIGYIQKEFSLFTPRFSVYVNGWTVEGDFFGWEYKIKNGINTVATISKELFNFTDTYTIVVKEENALEALLVVLAIDAVKCSKNK
jgi:uncharacterized protein YxjI